MEDGWEIFKLEMELKLSQSQAMSINFPHIVYYTYTAILLHLQSESNVAKNQNNFSEVGTYLPT